MTCLSRGGVLVITGGGRGIGRELARYLAPHYDTTLLVSRSLDELQTTARLADQREGSVIPVVVDVTNPEAVQHLFAEVVSGYGPLRLVVNNAGRFRGIGPVSSVSVDEWWRDVAVNLLGPMLVSRAAIPVFRQHSGRRYLINVLGGGFATPLSYGSGYAASKAGLARLTDCLAQELQPDVMVFGLGPGFHHTALAEYQRKSPAGRQFLPQVEDLFRTRQPTSPESLADVVAWMTSGAIDGLSGRIFTVDDDRERIVNEQDRIEADDLYALRVRRL